MLYRPYAIMQWVQQTEIREKYVIMSEPGEGPPRTSDQSLLRLHASEAHDLIHAHQSAATENPLLCGCRPCVAQAHAQSDESPASSRLSFSLHFAGVRSAGLLAPHFHCPHAFLSILYIISGGLGKVG